MNIIVFWEDNFPCVDSTPVQRQALQQALAGHRVAFVETDRLAEALAETPDLLVLPYGAAFPKAAWTAIVAYLKRGGRWVNLGGAPLTRPVRREGDGWQVEVLQPNYAKACMLRHTWEVPLPDSCALQVPEAEQQIAGIQELMEALTALKPQRIWSLQVMLADSGSLLFPMEPGASGVRQAVFRPVVQVMNSVDPYPLGAAVSVIDSLQGPYMGGRWVLAACQTQVSFSAAFIRAACELALQPLVRLEVRPGFGCYYAGEQPTAVIRAATRHQLALQIEYEMVSASDSRRLSAGRITVACGGADTVITMPPVAVTAPGLYAIRAWACFPDRDEVIAAAANGFWLYDEDFMASSEPFELDHDYFRRGGKPYPVTGTTYMSTETHRSWMFEPTPLAWDRDFAAMKQAGINMIRTGFWMGWRRMMPEPGAMDEGILRAIQAFLLTARQHDIPVILTLFAFLPETWGGGNPYCAPSAIAAQSAFINALAQRLAPANHLLWDLINEPSYADPKALWSFRASGDAPEAAAWQAWLRDQGVAEDEWRERWRLLPNEALSVPGPGDLSYWHNQQCGARPLIQTDFACFAQDAFTKWAAALRDVLRANGNANQWVTVGQDEAGTRRSPSTHFHAASVDFTSNHPWWDNDDILWNSVATKTPLCPNLLEEAGVMFAESVAGLPQRSPGRVRDLLERKLVLSFAGGCAGFIQWLWNTAIYNPSDNEAGIGLLHADGSAKPELAALSRIAAFMKRNAAHLEKHEKERVVVVLPHSNIFSVRDTANEAARRGVRVLEYHLGLPSRVVSEMFPARAGDADLIVLPSPRILREECWQALLARASSGATLLVTGYVEDDSYWRAVARLAPFSLSTHPVEVEHEECLALPEDHEESSLRVLFSPSLEIEKAVAKDGNPLPLQVLKCGRGRIVYCPLPIEHARSEAHTASVYRLAAETAGLRCAENGSSPGVLVRPVLFGDSALCLIANESNGIGSVLLDHHVTGCDMTELKHRVSVPAGRAAMMLVGRKCGRILDTCGLATVEQA